MKTILSLTAAWIFAASLSDAPETAGLPAAPPRVGVYDSRLVAYAHFWSPAEQQRRDERIRAAKAARAAGESTRANELGAALSAEQSRVHLEVFSTAPADTVMSALAPRLPAILRETGVTRLISRWDEAALVAVPAAQRIDVTDRLVGEFELTAERKQMLNQIRQAKPLPLEKARALDGAGKL